ncbi:MAG: winged helix-turn-helix transcriptional regulator [Candidatus Diapherotrites archaeon]|nr:winged helix-turn-helix transcriptional regulator [Candidatus Diapherotrites archaeon]
MKADSSVSNYRCFEVLANPLRLKIISELKKNPKTVLGLAGSLHEEQSKISHALQVLRKCRFVHVDKRGKGRIYSISENFGKMKARSGILDAIAFYKQNVCRVCSKEHGA